MEEALTKRVWGWGGVGVGVGGWGVGGGFEIFVVVKRERLVHIFVLKKKHIFSMWHRKTSGKS